MTFKTDLTIEYAHDFYEKLAARPTTPFVVIVDDDHNPRMLEVGSQTANRWERTGQNRIAGYYRGIGELTPADIAAAIDEIDDYVPRKYRAPEYMKGCVV
jgi:hypothetical protein